MRTFVSQTTKHKGPSVARRRSTLGRPQPHSNNRCRRCHRPPRTQLFRLRRRRAVWELDFCAAPCFASFSLFLSPRPHPASAHRAAAQCRIKCFDGAAATRASRVGVPVRWTALVRVQCARSHVAPAGRPFSHALSRPHPSPHTPPAPMARTKQTARCVAGGALRSLVSHSPLPLAASTPAARRPASSWPPRPRASRRPRPAA